MAVDEYHSSYNQGKLEMQVTYSKRSEFSVFQSMTKVQLLASELGSNLRKSWTKEKMLSEIAQILESVMVNDSADAVRQNRAWPLNFKPPAHIMKESIRLVAESYNPELDAQKRDLEMLFWNYGIESLEDGVFDGKNSCVASPLACPVTYLGSEDHTTAIAVVSRLQRVVACDEWASWQPWDFEAAYKKPPTTEVYWSEMDYYTFSDAVAIDLENQDDYVLNFYYVNDKTVENVIEFSSDKPFETWHISKVNFDRNWYPGWRVAVAYACILPTPQPCMFRCTRNGAYRGHDILGNTDISARQGHYIEAMNEKEAIAKMSTQFPYDKLGFTATLWNQ